MSFDSTPHGRPSRKQRLRDKRPERYSAIIRVATRDLATLGYTATNVNQIAAEAGVGVGTLYSYFDDKDDLFLTCVELAAATDFETKQRRCDLSAPALDILRSIIRVDRELMEIDPDGQQLLKSVFYGLNSRAPWVAEAQRLYQGSIDLVERALEKGEQEGVLELRGETRLVALMINGMMETFHVLGGLLDSGPAGASEPSVASSTPPPAERALALLCRGILRDKGGHT